MRQSDQERVWVEEGRREPKENEGGRGEGRRERGKEGEVLPSPFLMGMSQKWSSQGSSQSLYETLILQAGACTHNTTMPSPNVVYNLHNYISSIIHCTWSHFPVFVPRNPKTLVFHFLIWFLSPNVFSWVLPTPSSQCRGLGSHPSLPECCRLPCPIHLVSMDSFHGGWRSAGILKVTLLTEFPFLLRIQPKPWQLGITLPRSSCPPSTQSLS